MSSGAMRWWTSLTPHSILSASAPTFRPGCGKLNN